MTICGSWRPRARRNTVLATAYDLMVFLQAVDEEAGLSARTVRRRLSSVSGLFGYLLARGDVSANPVPRGLPTRRERQRPRQGVPLIRTLRTLQRILGPT